jgi:hypothetical protein
MPSPLDTVLSNLSGSLVVLVGAATLASRSPRGVASWWKGVAEKIQTLYTDLRIYNAPFELLLTDSAFVG